MQRRKFLIGMGSLAAGGAAAMGTGALESVTADRTITVDTAGDAAAYLGLEGDGEYITNDSGGTLSIDLGQALSSAEGGNGFNDEAITDLEDVVTITNRGTDSVNINLVEDDVQAGVSFSFNIEDLTDDDRDDVEPGQVRTLDVRVNTLDENPQNNLGTLTIEANSSE